MCPLALRRWTACPPADSETLRLVAVVRLTLQLVVRGGPEPAGLFADYTWVHERYVRRYSTDRADGFRVNPYFRGSPG